MKADIAIVIAAFNRPNSLKRLLESVAIASYNDFQDITLIISIDYSGNDACQNVANKFNWAYGNKKIIQRTEKAGLKEHLLQCGDYVTDYDAIIVLEDDLYVTEDFFNYAQQAYSFYKDEEKIAGIGLYNYRYNEFAHCPFEPLTDAYDNYFLQVPCSWGQIWTKKQWKLFKEYYESENAPHQLSPLIPQAVLAWSTETSWKRIYFNYMVTTDKYFVYPRISLSTNFGDPGIHYHEPVLIWQTPLLIGKKNFRFSKIDESVCIYDSFLELDRKAFQRMTEDERSVSFDLNGSKPLQSIDTEYLFSSKRCSRPIDTFQSAFYPYECNILFGLKGSNTKSLTFFFGKTSSFKKDLHVHRLEHDMKRVFPGMYYLLLVAKEEVRKTISYQLGYSIVYLFSVPSKVKKRLKALFLS